ncbi:MAG TPA: DUF2769 domain-containing protein [Candidatus Anoxymicrobiaceae bacterium]|jgi:Protein of unknown function (DUF2769)
MPVVPVSDEISARCICPQCPSYPGNEPWLYCARGKSPQEVKQVSCICPGCPVWEEYGLSMTFYCVEGTEES